MLVAGSASACLYQARTVSAGADKGRQKQVATGRTAEECSPARFAQYPGPHPHRTPGTKAHQPAHCLWSDGQGQHGRASAGSGRTGRTCSQGLESFSCRHPDCELAGMGEGEQALCTSVGAPTGWCVAWYSCCLAASSTARCWARLLQRRLLYLPQLCLLHVGTWCWTCLKGYGLAVVGLFLCGPTR